MISRKTALKIAEMYAHKFTSQSSRRYSMGYEYRVNLDSLYDFLFENDYEAWFCNSVKTLFRKRELVEHVAKIHTGETLVNATSGWSQEDRERMAHEYLRNLARDILDYYYSFGKDSYEFKKKKDSIDELVRFLELDGYKYKDGILLLPEKDVLDIETERNYLEELINETEISNVETILHHLGLSEEHYIGGKWDDSISNSRKFMESIVRESALKHHILVNNSELDSKIYKKVGRSLNYLKKEGLLEQKEDQALADLYILLSDQGSHPFMAGDDQARLLRNLSLTVSQFVLLRLKGFINEK